MDHGKHNVLGVLVDAVDYDAAVARILSAAREGRACGVSPLAVHGVMSGVTDTQQRDRLNSLELVTPDGQPVRWALRLLHSQRLPDRVYGPVLMGMVLERAAAQSQPVYFYGSSQGVLERLVANVERRYPGLEIAGARPSRFRALSAAERDELAEEVTASGARILFAGLGCPRQEVFAYEMRERLAMPVVAVGAAFDYLAGGLREPAPWVQAAGLQWLVRLAQDPRRLWRRYLLLNPAYLVLLGLQACGLWRPSTAMRGPVTELRPG